MSPESVTLLSTVIGSVIVQTGMTLRQFAKRAIDSGEKHSEVMGHLGSLEHRFERMERRQGDHDLRLLNLEKKYAAVKVGETLIPEETDEVQQTREKVKHITGSYHPAKQKKDES